MAECQFQFARKRYGHKLHEQKVKQKTLRLGCHSDLVTIKLSKLAATQEFREIWVYGKRLWA